MAGSATATCCSMRAGGPMLAGVGVMGVLGDPGEALDDVMALARLLASLLDTRSKGATKVLTALGKPERTAADLATQLAEATPACDRSGWPDASRRRKRPRHRYVAFPGCRRFAVRVAFGCRRAESLSHGLAAAAGAMILLVSWRSSGGPAPVVRSARPSRTPPASARPYPAARSGRACWAGWTPPGRRRSPTLRQPCWTFDAPGHRPTLRHSGVEGVTAAGGSCSRAAPGHRACVGDVRRTAPRDARGHRPSTRL